MNLNLPKKQKIKKQPALLYLGRFQFEYFSEGATQSIKLPFAPEVVRDLDVVNSTTLNEQIKTFVTQYKLQPADLTILLADDILFTKNITVPDPKTREDAIQNFIDSVPFEETSIVKLPLQSSISISVANKSYHEAFRNAFESVGFSVPLVLPAFLLNKEVNLSKSSDVPSLSLALKRAGSFRNYSMLIPSVNSDPIHNISPSVTIKKSNKRVFVLAGVFGVLIIILIMVYISTSNSTLSVQTQNTNTNPPPEPVVQAAAEQTVTVSSIQSMRIVYQPEESDAADQVITQLSTLGIAAISSESAVTSTTSASLLSFPSTVSETDRGVVVNEIQKIIPELTVGENTTSTQEAVLIIN